MYMLGAFGFALTAILLVTAQVLYVLSLVVLRQEMREEFKGEIAALWPANSQRCPEFRSSAPCQAVRFPRLYLGLRPFQADVGMKELVGV